MRNAPFRPRDERITQGYNDGVLTVCAVSDSARPGYQPAAKLLPKGVLRYEEQRLGLQRTYLAKQAQVDVERVVRTPRIPGVSSQDVAVTEDGRQYLIDLVQSVDGVYPPSMDLTLARLAQKYDVSNLDTFGKPVGR